MQEKVIKAVRSYLERRGFEILVTGGDFDFIAKHEDYIVFIDVTWRREYFPKELETDREWFELVVIGHLNAYDWEPCRIRLDKISVAVLDSGDRACIRHHIDALNN